MPQGSVCPSPASVYLGFVNEVAFLCLVWQTWSKPPGLWDGHHTKYRAQRNNVETGALISESLELDSIFYFRDSHLCCLIEKNGRQHSWTVLSAPELRPQQYLHTGVFIIKAIVNDVLHSYCPGQSPSVLAFRIFQTHCSSGIKYLK